MKNILEKISNYYIVFIIYCLIGWLYEVLWMRFVVEPHRWINRGVLIGPFLPIYGFGMLILLVLYIELTNPLFIQSLYFHNLFNHYNICNINN